MTTLTYVLCIKAAFVLAVLLGSAPYLLKWYRKRKAARERLEVLALLHGYQRRPGETDDELRGRILRFREWHGLGREIE